MKLKRPHFEKLKSLTKKQKKLILAGIALLLLILAACYTVFIAPLLQKEQWIYKEETVERGTLKVGVTESGSLEYNTKSIDYDLDLDVSDDDEDDSDDDDDTVQKYLKIEEIYAASGQRVMEGEELLKFTEDSVEAVRALLQNAVVKAQSDYAEAESTMNCPCWKPRPTTIPRRSVLPMRHPSAILPVRAWRTMWHLCRYSWSRSRRIPHLCRRN